MVSLLTLFTNLLLTTASLARPSREGRHRGAVAARRSLVSVEGPGGSMSGRDIPTYWSGASLVGPYNEATATITVPTLEGPNGTSGAYFVAPYVGFGFNGCEPSMRAGVQANLIGGKVTYSAWCTVDPDKPSYFHNISINYGDEVSLTVIAGGKLGTAVIENHTTGEKVGETLTSRDDICRNGVNWMVELWGGFDNSANPFADFDTVTFSGAMASTSHGKSGLSNATEYTLTSSAEYKNLTTVLITDTNVIVQYKGN